MTASDFFIILAAFLASAVEAVEAVEALTIVLAVGLTVRVMRLQTAD